MPDEADAQAAVVVEAAVRVLDAGGDGSDLARMLSSKYGDGEALRLACALLLPFIGRAFDEAAADDGEV